MIIKMTMWSSSTFWWMKIFFLCYFLEPLTIIDAAPAASGRSLISAPVGARKYSRSEHQKAIDALFHRGMLEGDIVIRRRSGVNRTKNIAKFRNAVSSDDELYPNGVIPYVIESDLASQTDLIRRAMNQISRHTCIQFRERTANDKYFISIFKGSGCYASIGRDVDFPDGLVSLGEGCYYIGTVVHELMHAIGYYHEHNRHDRDDYLKIYFENIAAGEESQFNKNTPTMERILTAFDYNSVMLYGPRAFSKDGHAITMEPNREGFYMIEVHEKPGLTAMDAQSIKLLYKCP